MQYEMDHTDKSNIVMGGFREVRVIRISSNIQIQRRKILESTIGNPNHLAQSVGKLSHCENPSISLFLGVLVFFGGWGGPIFFRILDPKQNDISKDCTKSQPSN